MPLQRLHFPCIMPTALTRHLELTQTPRITSVDVNASGYESWTQEDDGSGSYFIARSKRTIVGKATLAATDGFFTLKRLARRVPCGIERRSVRDASSTSQWMLH